MRAGLAILLMAPLFGSTVARADDLRGVWFSGATVSDSKSVYAGAVVALPGDRLGSGLAIRASGNAGEYHYDRLGQPIRARYLGGEVAAVYQLSGSWGWANFSIGPRFTKTSLRPNDASNDRRGNRVDLGLQADGARDSAHWRLGWFGSLAAFDRAYQARIQLGRKIDDHARLGAELGVQGDRRYTQESAGGFVALPLAGRAEIQLGAGGSFQHGRAAQPYASVSVSSVF